MGDEQENAFIEIVEKLSSKPILKLPDYEKEFILKTDASGIGFGGALVQIHDGIEHPISFFSEIFRGGQRTGWNHWHREAFAVIFGIKRYHQYLIDKKFIIVTDNESLLTLIKKQTSLTNHMIDRWRMFLLPYDYEIRHRPGKKLVIEDSLSRSINFNALQNMENFGKEKIEQAQQQDNLIKTLINIINGKINISDINNKEINNIYNNNKENLILDNNILYYLKTDKKAYYDYKRIVIPKEQQQMIIFQYHNTPTSGHLSFDKTYYKVRKNVWFSNMYTIIHDYCNKCSVCDENRKYFKVTDKLKPIITTQPMELIEFDHCGPFVKTKNDNNYVLSVIDHFTRKRWFIPTKSTTAEETIHRLIDNVFCPFGFPRVILTDQGSGFTSKLMKELMLITNIKPEFALPRQHNTMGSVENSNKIMEEIVRKYVDRDQETWDELVKFAAYALNNTKSAAHGFTPDYLFFGRKEINPYAENEQVIVNEEIKYEDYANKIKKRLEKSFKIANENLIRYRNEMIKYYDKKRRGLLPVLYYKDDWVYLNKPDESVVKELSHKFDKQSLGPYKVIQVDNERGNILIEIAPEKDLLVKHNDIRLAKDQNKLNDGVKIEESKNKLIPTNLNEIIIINDLIELEKLIKKKIIGRRPNKKKMTVKDLVGKRVKIEWKTGEYRGWHKGTVIGYTSNLTNSLVYYDQRDLHHDPRTDYYAHNLFSQRENWAFL